MMRMLDMRLEHRHGDDWHTLRPADTGHTIGPSDPERGWGGGRLFRCVDCDHEIRVAPVDEADMAPGRMSSR